MPEILGLDEVLGDSKPAASAASSEPSGPTPEIEGLDEVLGQPAEPQAPAQPPPSGPTGTTEINPFGGPSFREGGVAYEDGYSHVRRVTASDRAAEITAWRARQATPVPDADVRAVKTLALMNPDMDLDWIARNMDVLKPRLDQANLARVLSGSPRLREWMERDDVKAAAAREHAESLGWIEKWVTGESGYWSGRAQAALDYLKEHKASTAVRVGLPWLIPAQLVADRLDSESDDARLRRLAHEAEQPAGGPTAPVLADALAQGMRDQDVNSAARAAKMKVTSGQTLTPEESTLLDALARRPESPWDMSEEGFIARGVTGAVGMAPYLALSTGVEVSASGAAKALISNAGWIGKAATVATPILAQTLLNKQQFDGGLFLSLRSMTNANGNRLFTDKQAADWAEGIAWAQAVATGPLTHVVSAGIVSGGARNVIASTLKNAPAEGARKAAADAMRKAATDALLEKAMEVTAKNVVWHFTKSQVAGLANVLTMNTVVKVGEALAVSSVTGQPADLATAAREAVKETWDFLPTSFALGFVASRKILGALGREHLSWAEASRRKVLEDAIRSNPLFKPEEPSSYAGEAEWNAGKIALGSDSVTEMMAHLAQGEVVYVDRAAFERVAQEAKADPVELAGRIMEDGGKAYREAVALKSDDLAIPAGQFYGRLGGTELFPKLRDDIRLNQGHLTNRQAKARQEKWAAKEEEYRKVKTEEMPDDQRGVYEDYRAKALAVGVSEVEADANARIVAAAFRTWAECLSEGKPAAIRADELYQAKARVKIFAPGVDKAGRATPAAEVEKYRKAGEAYAAKATEQAPAGEAEPGAEPVQGAAGHLAGEKVTPESMFVDENSGALNERAWERSEAPPDKPMVAVVEPEGGKWLNDSPAGYAQGDALLRTTAKALHEAGAGDIYKVGGNFRFHTSPEHFADVMQKAREAMGDKRFELRSAIGSSVDEAGERLGREADEARAAGKMAKRGERPLGVPPEAKPEEIAFPEGRAPGAVPEHLQQKFAAMPEHEARTANFVEAGTKILNEDGYRRTPKKKHAAMLDMDGLKALNAKLGKASGNAALKALGAIMEELGGAKFFAAHLHGDEYAAQHDDPVALKAYVDSVVEAAQSYRAIYELSDGTFAVVNGLGVSAGIGEGHGRATEKLHQNKTERADAGKRGDDVNERRFRKFETRKEAEAALGGLGRLPDLQRGRGRRRGPARAGNDRGPGAVRDETAKAGSQAGQVAAERAETSILTPQRGNEPATYRVIEADDLVPSHNPDTFQPREDYPSGVQEREYHRQAEEQQKVVMGGQRLNPALLLADSPTPVDGPPIVTSGEKRLVLGGNGRSMMLLRGLKSEATADAYRKALAAKAEQFGLDRSAIDSMKRPVLVREVPLSAGSPRSELQAAVRRYNEGLTQHLAPKAQAIAESRMLTDATIGKVGDLLAASDGSLRDLLREKPADIVKALRDDGVVTQQNQTEWISESGALTDSAKDRLERMFLGRVVESGDRLAATAPSLLAKVERAVPSLLRVAGINPGLDEMPTIRAALDLLNEAKSRGVTLAHLLSQRSLFGQDAASKASNDVRLMAGLLDQLGQKALGERFKTWAARAAVDPRQRSMFGAGAPTSEEARSLLFDGVKGVPLRGNEPAEARAAAGEIGLGQPRKPKPLSALHRKAIEEFGTTDNPLAAGYVLPDGQMLNFAEEGGDGTRSMDHREIRRSLPEKMKGENWSDGMISFVGTGAMRISMNGAPDRGYILSAHLQKAPSPAQFRRLGELLRYADGDVSIDISDGKGNTKATFEMSHAKMSDVKDFLAEQFGEDVASLFQPPAPREVPQSDLLLNDEGEPQTFHHGSKSKFPLEQIRGDEAGLVYFAPEIKTAKYYGKNIHQAHIHSVKPLDLGDDAYDTRKLTRALRNAGRDDLAEKVESTSVDENGTTIGVFKHIRNPEIVKALQDAGYDSFRFRDDHDEYWKPEVVAVAPDRVRPTSDVVIADLGNGARVVLAQPSFHGSPHRGIEKEGFKLGRVSGVGGRSYGWGLYFSDSKNYADEHRIEMSGPPDVTLFANGKALEPHNNKARGTVLQELAKTVGLYDDAGNRPDLVAIVAKYKARLDDVIKRKDASAGSKSRAKKELAELIKIESEGELTASVQKSGQTYQVDLPENDRLLDYDKPLNEQPGAVRDVLLNATDAPWSGSDSTQKTGEWFYHKLAESLGSEKAASEWLRDHGIPGLRYRYQFTDIPGEGTHNYTIWDENEIRNISTLYQQQQQLGPRWYSQAERAAAGAKQAKGTPDSWWAVISKSPGVRAEELENVGLKEWLSKQGKSVTREEVTKFLEANRLEVTERELGGQETEQSFISQETLTERSDEMRNLLREAGWSGTQANDLTDRVAKGHKDPSSFASEGEELVEAATRLREAFLARETARPQYTQYEGYVLGGHKEGSYRELLFYAPGSEGYLSHHFGEHGKNLLAHARISEHDVGGKRTLMIEEVQSDLHQAAREKGYASKEERDFDAELKALHQERQDLLDRTNQHGWEGMPPEAQEQYVRLNEREAQIQAEQWKSKTEHVPDAPLKTSWDEFIIKRIIRYAAEKGYERITWTTGEQQAERYDLAKQVDQIHIAFDPGKDSGRMTAIKDGAELESGNFASTEQLGDVIGKEAAKKAIEKRSGDEAVLEGTDLKVGGEGMRFFYDKRIPGIVDKLVKKFGGKVEKKASDSITNPHIANERSRREQKLRDAVDRLKTATEKLEELENAARDGQEWIVGEERINDWTYQFSLQNARRDVAFTTEEERIYRRELESMPALEYAEVWSVDIPPALAAKALAEGFPLFQRKGDSGGERGYIYFTMPDGKGPRRFDIHLLEGADRSTLAHETFHMLAEVFGDLASAADAPEQMRADYATLLKYMGHESHEARTAATEERMRLSAKADRTPEEDARLVELKAKEERASHAWEQYLWEGKAPDASLVRVFAKFRSWIGAIYRKIGGPAGLYKQTFGRELELSDDVRRVFDRMLSADVAASDAVDIEHRPMPEAVLNAMPPQERADYLKKAEEERAAATTALVRRMAEAGRKENNIWAREEKASISKQVDEELSALPVYRALEYLQKGLPGAESPADAGPRLDRDAIAATYGKQTALQLERTHPDIFGEEGRPAGAPEEIAAFLGYSSADEMMQQLLQADRKSRAVAAETERRFKEKYGPALEDGGDRLAAEAMDAVHDERHATQVLRELHALAKLVDPEMARGSPEASKEVIQATAGRILEDKTVREVNPEAFLRMERSAAQKAFEAADTGNIVEAYAQKQAQALHVELYRQARELERQLEQAQRYLKNATSEKWSGFLGKAEPAFRDANDAILGAVGIGPGVPVGAAQSALAELERVVMANALTVGFDMDGLRNLAAYQRDWRDLNVADARNVSDAIHNLRAWARSASTFDAIEEQAQRGSLLSRMKAAVAKLPKPGLGSIDRGANTAWYKAAAMLRAVDAALLSPESMIRILDGGGDGAFHEAFWRPYLKARNLEASLSREFAKNIMAQWEKLPEETRKRLHERVDLSSRLPTPSEILEATNATDKSVTRLRLIMIALNLGNDGNKQRLLDGYQWDEHQVMAVLNDPKIGLSKAEWDWVQSIWDGLETFYPKLAALHERETGLKLGKIEATPVQTPWGEYRGGYFPAKYDPRPGTKQGQRRFMSDEKAIASVLAPSLFYPAVQHGHRQARAERVEDVIDLDWSVVPSHVSQVIHDLAFRESVRNMARIVVAPGFESTVASRLGEDRAKQFRAWLQAVATSQADSVPAHLRGINGLFGWMKNRAVIAGVGHSLSVALGDLSNPLVAAAAKEVKLSELAKVTAKLGVDWAAQRKFALENSPELQLRADRAMAHLRREMGEMGESQAAGASALRKVQESAFYFMEQTDKMTATPVWLARYRQELKAGRTHEQAVEAADGAVRRVFPAENLAEQAALLRSRGAVGGLLMFYGYFNKLYNVNRALVHEAWMKWHDGEAGLGSKMMTTAEMAGRILGVAFASSALAELLSGRGREDDETWAEWALRKTLVAPFQSLPFVGTPIETLYSKLTRGHAQQVSVRNAPGLALIQDVANRAAKLAETGKDDAVEKLFDAIDVAGLLAGVPTRQARKTISYGIGLATGEKNPKTSAHAAAGLVYGEKQKNQTGNVVTAASDAADALR